MRHQFADRLADLGEFPAQGGGDLVGERLQLADLFAEVADLLLDRGDGLRLRFGEALPDRGDVCAQEIEVLGRRRRPRRLELAGELAQLLFDALDRLLRRGFLDGAGEAGGEAVELHRALQRLDLGGDLLELLFYRHVLRVAAAGGIGVGVIEELRLGELVFERVLPGGDLGERIVDVVLGLRDAPCACCGSAGRAGGRSARSHRQGARCGFLPPRPKRPPTRRLGGSNRRARGFRGAI